MIGQRVARALLGGNDENPLLGPRDVVAQMPQQVIDDVLALNGLGDERIGARSERSLTREYFDRLRVRAPSIDAPLAGLSGGNQQKVVLARWLAAHSRVLILDEPTRGVDVGAKAEIQALIDETAEGGVGVLLISSELEELVEGSARVVVLRDGRSVAELRGAEITQAAVLRAMAGGDGR